MLHSVQNALAPRYVLPAARIATPRTDATSGTTTADSAATAPAAASITVTTTTAWWISIRIQMTSTSSATAQTTPTETPAAQERDETNESGRAGIARALHQLDRAVRHELHDIMKSVGELDPSLRHELRAIAKEFRHDLQAAFRDAADGNGVDAAKLLEGVEAALRELADELGSLIGEETPAAGIVSPTAPPESVDPVDTAPTAQTAAA